MMRPGGKLARPIQRPSYRRGDWVAPLRNSARPSAGALTDPALRSFHLFSWGGYRTEAMTFTPPVALDTWSTVDNGDGTHTATINTLGAAPHGLISGRPFVLKRSNGSVLTPISSAYVSTTQVTATFNEARVGESGTVESANPRIATFTNPGAWGGTVSKAILASRPELEVLAGVAGLRSDGTRFLNSGLLYSSPECVEGITVVMVIYYSISSLVNRFVTPFAFGSGNNLCGMDATYNSATSFRLERGIDGANMSGATTCMISPLSQLTGKWSVIQMCYRKISAGFYRAHRRIDNAAWADHPTSIASTGSFNGNSLGWSIAATLGGSAPHEAGIHVASLDAFHGDRRDDPELFAWLSEKQPGPTYPTP